MASSGNEEEDVRPLEEQVGEMVLGILNSSHSTVNVGAIEAAGQECIKVAQDREKRERLREKRRLQREKFKVKKPPKHSMVRRSIIRDIMENLAEFEITGAMRRTLREVKGSGVCRVCREVKPDKEFHGRGLNRLKTECKTCTYIRLNESPRENFIKHLLKQTRDRANRKKWEFDLTLEDLENLCTEQYGRCALSGQPMTFFMRAQEEHERIAFCRHPTNASVDRIDSGQGYTPENIQLTTVAVNQSKGEMSQRAFLQMCKDVTAKDKSVNGS